MPTMLDVAKRAGVSLSTVSYALNGTRPISEETRQRIFSAMDELGYRPHVLARGLASKRSRIIALLFPAADRGLGNTELEFVTSASTAARDGGYSMVLWSYEMRAEELRQIALQGLVDGVVVMEVHSNDERVNLLREIGVPFTMIGRCADNTGLTFVDIDFEQTARDVVNYLKGLGHRKIALLNQSEASFESGYGPVVRTHEGFLRAAQDAGVEALARFCRTTPMAGYEVVRDLLDQAPDLTALVAINERAISGAMRAIAESGLRIPADFSLVVIVSSSLVAEMMTPHLTTMDSPSVELGRLGVELLIQKLEEKNREVEQILVPCQLVQRDSSGVCFRHTNGSSSK